MKYLNVDFRIVITDNRIKSGCKSRKQKRHLIGRSGLINAVGYDLANRMVTRVYNQNSAKITCKLRRGLIVEFYAK